MTKKRTSKNAAAPTPEQERAAHLAALRRHKRVLEGADCEAAALPPGVTHVLIDVEEGAPQLIEKRKSFI